MTKFLLQTAIMALLFVFGGCRKNEADKSSGDRGELSGRLVIFHAGSLTIPFEKMRTAFIRQHPDVEIIMEAAGSRTCARKISELKMRCDVLASADYAVINRLLIPEYAKWNIRFAANEMTIVYHAASRGANEINSGNWYRILLRPDVIFGRSDPDSDPCGYRTVLTAKLAEKYYAQPGLASKILAKDRRYIRPKETDLLALLESDAIDYIFLYRSVAQQHHLKYVILPDEINLKSAKYAEFYKTATVKISGKKPGTFITRHGAPMIYGVTIPSTCCNKKAALAFIDFMLGPAGQKIMRENGQPSVIPTYSETFSAIPATLQKYAKDQ